MSSEQMNAEVPSKNIGVIPLRARMPYHGLLLGAICLSMSLALLIGYQFTRSGIEASALKDKLENLGQVLPSSLYDNNPVHDVQIIHDDKLSDQPIEVYLAKRGGQLSGMAFQVKRPGYGGPITLLMALDASGNILGVRVLNHRETPGLADRIDITKDNWITRFDHHSLANTTEKQWHVKKDGGDFDQFTGATITPRAVVGAVYQGLLFHERHFLQKDELHEADAQKSSNDSAEEKSP